MMQINTNNPPIYDTRYLYLIDCRPMRKKFEKSRIHTAIHFTDLLNDSVYLSPPIDNYTLVVLYDDDGTFLTSSAPPTGNLKDSSSFNNINANHNAKLPRFDHNDSTTSAATAAFAAACSSMSSDEIIASLKAKINCSPAKTIYILSGGFEQFYAKFPFMCSSQEIRSTTDRHKYLTIYPNCVIENQIYIGSGVQVVFTNVLFYFIF